MRGPPRVMVYLVQRRLAAADVRSDVLDIGCASDAGRHVGAGNLQTDSMTAPKQIGHRQNLDVVFVDLARHDLDLRLTRQRMPGAPRLGARPIERAVRGLEPAPGQLAL